MRQNIPPYPARIFLRDTPPTPPWFLPGDNQKLTSQVKPSSHLAWRFFYAQKTMQALPVSVYAVRT
jgi:hypothetical protein